MFYLENIHKCSTGYKSISLYWKQRIMSCLFQVHSQEHNKQKKNTISYPVPYRTVVSLICSSFEFCILNGNYLQYVLTELVLLSQKSIFISFPFDGFFVTVPYRTVPYFIFYFILFYFMHWFSHLHHKKSMKLPTYLHTYVQLTIKS